MNELLTISPYCIYPPATGGPKRIFYLNRGMVRHGWKVFQFSGSTKREGNIFTLLSNEKEIYPDYVEYKNFNPLMHYFNRALTIYGYPLMGFSLFPKILFNPSILHKQLSSHKFVMLEHPYLYYQLKNKIKNDQVLVLNAHNIEYKLYEESMHSNPIRKWMVKRLFKMECEAFRRADISFVCSDEDKAIAIDLFEADAERIHVAPNGVDVPAMHVIGDTERLNAKKILGLEDKIIALFVGSKWPPNTEAVHELVKMATNRSDIHYLVVGGVGHEFSHVNSPNITFTGFVDDLSLYMAAADLAVNPMVSGSGTNIKMFEYLAAGLPVVSTSFGARGLTGNDNGAVVSSTLEQFPDKVLSLLEDKERLSAYRLSARDMVEQHYDWTMIAGQMSEDMLKEGKQR